MAGRLDLVSLGAKGDGVSNDTGPFNAALAAVMARGSGEVYLPVTGAAPGGQTIYRVDNAAALLQGLDGAASRWLGLELVGESPSVCLDYTGTGTFLPFTGRASGRTCFAGIHNLRLRQAAYAGVAARGGGLGTGLALQYIDRIELDGVDFIGWAVGEDVIDATDITGSRVTWTNCSIGVRHTTGEARYIGGAMTSCWIGVHILGGSSIAFLGTQFDSDDNAVLAGRGQSPIVIYGPASGIAFVRCGFQMVTPAGVAGQPATVSIDGGAQDVAFLQPQFIGNAAGTNAAGVALKLGNCQGVRLYGGTASGYSQAAVSTTAQTLDLQQFGFVSSGQPCIIGPAAPAGGVPAATPGPDSGAGAPMPIVAAGSTDARGRLTAGTGAVPNGGWQVYVAFSRPFGSPPVVTLTPENAVTAVMGQVYAAQVTASGFYIGVPSPPGASKPATNYAWSWLANGGAV